MEWTSDKICDGLSQLQVATDFGVRGRPVSRVERQAAKDVAWVVEQELDHIASEIKSIKAEVAEESGLLSRLENGLSWNEAQALTPIE
eukprot:718470-Rhodomonas_salina.1